MQKRKFLFFIFFVFLTLFSKAQTDTTKFNFGIEQDILPYILKGYFISGWVGYDHVRLRGSYATSQIPGFYLKGNLIADEVAAMGLSIEYVAKNNFEGLWFGPGIGYWYNKYTIQAAETVEGTYHSAIFSFGGGYNFSIWKNLYCSPWVALHSRIKGSTAKFGEYDYPAARITPEVSFKIGWKLR